MKFNQRTTVYLLVVILLVLALAGCGAPKESPPEVNNDKQGEEFPERTVNIIVTWPAGGRTDTWVRAIAIPMEEYLGVPVIVSNHSGGGGIVGAQAVAQSGATGYTLGAFTIAHYIGEHMKEPPFKSEAFEPVAGFNITPYALAVNANAPFDTLEEFIAYAKENPGKIRYGTAGKGSEDHFRTEVLYKKIGIEGELIPYLGDAPVITALLGEEINVTLLAISPLVPHHKSGGLKILAVADKERSKYLPDVPTFMEEGVDFTGSTWTGFFVPQGTPAEVVAKLDEAVKMATEDPEFKKVMEHLYSPVAYWSSQELAENVELTKKWILDVMDEIEIE